MSSRGFMICWFYLYLNITTTTVFPYDDWIQHSSPLLPWPISHNAIGYDPYNHTIWLLGSFTSDYSQQLISFDYMNNTFTDYGLYGLPRDLYGLSQNYAQIGTILYIGDYDHDKSYINSFNMKTMDFTTNYTSPPLYLDGVRSCFVNIRNEYIAVLGDDGTVQILNIQSQLWLESVPSLNVGRQSSSCIYINDKMFDIGGMTSSSVLQSSIEYLNVSSLSMMNIESMSWEYNTESLPYPFSHSRCITVNDDILVIGGYAGVKSETTQVLDTIHIIDSINGSVSLGGHLGKATFALAPIFVNNTIYCFGGYSDISAWNGWQSISGINVVSTAVEPSNASKYPITSTTPFDELHKPTVETIIESYTLSATSNSSTTKDPSISSNDSSPFILFTAGIIVSFCVFCVCIILIWKAVTQKQWDPEPHPTAGVGTKAQRKDAPYLDDEDDGDDPKKRKRVSSISLCDVLTIEGPSNVENAIEDGQFTVAENIDIQNVQQKMPSNEHLDDSKFGNNGNGNDTINTYNEGVDEKVDVTSYISK